MTQNEFEKITKRCDAEQINDGVFAFAIQHQFKLSYKQVKNLTVQEFKIFLYRTAMASVKVSIDKI